MANFAAGVICLHMFSISATCHKCKVYTYDKLQQNYRYTLIKQSLNDRTCGKSIIHSNITVFLKLSVILKLMTYSRKLVCN